MTALGILCIVLVASLERYFRDGKGAENSNDQVPPPLSSNSNLFT